MFHRAIFLLLAAGLAMAGCTVAENPTNQDTATGTDPDRDLPEDYWATTAIVDWGQPDLADPVEQQKFARADFVVLETAAVWRDGLNEGALDAIRELNPDIRIVGYVNAHDSWLAWGEGVRSTDQPARYATDWYAATREYWSYTTTGDTMFSWPGKVLLNVLDPACRQAIVQVLVDHWSAHSNVLDGIFWDHFNDYLWVPQDIAGVEGEMDLDGDGIAHRDDEDEMAAYRAASEDLILRVRNALGDDVIQVANGARATTDSTFASLLDGMFYEHFPRYAWGRDEVGGALDPERHNNLFAARSWARTQNGGPWLILSSTDRFLAPGEDQELVLWRRSEFNRVIGLLTGTLPVYYPEGAAYRYGWPEVEVDLGPPAGPATFEDTRIVREFARGHIVLDFAGAGGQVPFEFAIVERDSIRQRYEMDDYTF